MEREEYRKYSFFKRRASQQTHRKEGRILISSWGYLNRKLPFIELPWEIPALCLSLIHI